MNAQKCYREKTPRIPGKKTTYPTVRRSSSSLFVPEHVHHRVVSQVRGCAGLGANERETLLRRPAHATYVRAVRTQLGPSPPHTQASRERARSAAGGARWARAALRCVQIGTRSRQVCKRRLADGDACSCTFLMLGQAPPPTHTRSRSNNVFLFFEERSL